MPGAPAISPDTRTKYLLYAAIAGAGLWIVTELLEMRAAGGHSPVSLWLTTIWHPILALGFWGLHKLQSPASNTLSLVATALVSIALLAFAPLSVMFLYSGAASLDAFVQQRLYFQVAGLLMVIGIVLFGAAMIRTGYYASWMGYGVLAALLLVVIRMMGQFPELLQHAGFIGLSLIIVGMALTGLRTLRAPA
jgi:hypothetical protein